jgi:RNA polymerase sigma-70 factor (ECF subfamily)
MGSHRTPYGEPPDVPRPAATERSLELFEHARAGDSQALGRLFARYVPRLHRFAHGRVPAWARNAVDTADLVQETILGMLRNMVRIEPRGDGALLRYLRRAMLNRIRNQFRHAARHPAPAELDADTDDAHHDGRPSPLDVAIEREDRRRYAAALKRLRPQDRDAVVGRIELGYSYEQLALALGKSTPEAARLAVRRALLRLCDEMRDVS